MYMTTDSNMDNVGKDTIYSFKMSLTELSKSIFIRKIENASPI